MSSSPPPLDSPRLGPVDVSACLSAFVLIGASQALHGPALPGLAARFGIDTVTAALIVGAHWSGALASVLALLLLPERIRARIARRSAAACVAIALGASLVAGAPAFGVVLLGSAAIGGGYGWLTVALNDLFARGAAGRGSVMVNLLNAAFGVGAIAAPLVMIRLGFDHRSAFAALGVGALLVVPPLLRLDDRPRLVTPLETRRAGGRASTPWTTLVGVGLVVAFEASLAAWGPSALQNTGAEARASTLALSFYFAVFLGARLAAAGLSVVLSQRVLLLGTLSIASVACLGALLAQEPIAFFAVAGVVGAAFPAAFLWGTTRLNDPIRGAPTVVVAALCGGIGGPVSVGYLSRTTGETSLFALLTGLGAVAFAVVLYCERSRSPGVGADRRASDDP